MCSHTPSIDAWMAEEFTTFTVTTNDKNTIESEDWYIPF